MPKNEKRISWETLCRVRMNCGLCHKISRCAKRELTQDDCPLWASLDDVGEKDCDHDWHPWAGDDRQRVCYNCHERQSIPFDPTPAAKPHEGGMKRECEHVWRETKHYTLVCIKCGEEIYGSTALDEMSDKFDIKKYEEMKEQIQTPDDPDTGEEE